MDNKVLEQLIKSMADTLKPMVEQIASLQDQVTELKAAKEAPVKKDDEDLPDYTQEEMDEMFGYIRLQ